MSTWVDEVRQQLSIIDIASRYTQLRKMGTSWRGPCPIHGGEGPNFAVYPQRGTYRCYVCNERGDGFSLVMKKEGLEFLDAAKFLASLLGVTIQERRVQRSDDEKKRIAYQNELIRTNRLEGWNRLGITEAAQALGATGRKVDGGEELLIPLVGVGGVPQGWARYRLEERSGHVYPIRCGFDDYSHASVHDMLYMPPHLRANLHGDVLLVVDEPVAVLYLQQLGYRAAVCPADGAFAADRKTVLSPAQVERIAELGVRCVAFLLTVGDGSPAKRARWQSIFATEPRLVERGVEPLIILPTESLRSLPDALDCAGSWAWLRQIEGGAEAIRTLLRSNRQTVDLFQLRVMRVAKRLRARALSLNQAIEKIAPTLRAARLSGDRVLYHAYVAWAARGLGLTSRRDILRHLDGGPVEAETF